MATQLTSQQLATLLAELNTDPYGLGYAAYFPTTDVVSLTALLNWLRNGINPCPTNNILGPSGTITNATAATPIVFTTASPHGLSNGDAIIVQNIGGIAAANSLSYFQGGVTYYSTFFVNVQSTTKLQLYSDPARANPVTGTGTYTSGGTWQWCIGSLANGTKLVDQFVKVSDISSNIAVTDIGAAITNTQQQVVAMVLPPQGSVQLTDMLGNENNVPGIVNLLTTAGSVSRKAIKALEARAGSRVEQLLNLVNQSNPGQILNPNGDDVTAVLNGHYSKLTGWKSARSTFG